MPEAQTPARTITVTGTGRAAVKPDLADLRLGVTVTEPTVEAARSASALALRGVLARLRALGVEDRDLQTSIVSVNPQYDYSREGSPPRLVGYTFTNLVAALVREIDRVGDAIDAALSAGATNVDRIAFRVADQTSADATAREAAVADARTKADTLTGSLGMRVGEVLAIAETGVAIPFPTPFAEAAMLAGRDAGTPIEPGMNEVVASVVVTYRLEALEPG